MRPVDTGSVLPALAAQLLLARAPRGHLVVCGGTALNVLGFVERPTLDVDVVAVATTDERGAVSFISADPLPPGLAAAAARVAADFDLDRKWLNSGPTAAELETAALWCCSHDWSAGFREGLRETLKSLGAGDVALLFP